MEFDFKNKVVLVSGGSRGIGFGTSKMYLEHGAKVLLTYNKNFEKASELLEYAKCKNYDLEIFKLDLNYLESIHNFISLIDSKGIKNINILVNNAGISDINPIYFQDDEKILSIINVNLTNTIIFTKYILKNFMKENSKIINISSIWGEVGSSCEVAYSSSKGGINSFTKALSKELSFLKINVIGISPGIIDTEMNEGLTYEEKLEIINSIPLKRIGKIEDIVNAVKFFSKEDIKITGEIITVDGGWNLT